MKKAVHLTSVHPAGDVRIAWRECRSLAEAGWEVVLVAPAGPARLPRGVRHRPVPAAANRMQRILRTVPAVLRAALAEARAAGSAEATTLFHIHDPELIPVGLILRARGHAVVWDVHEDFPRQLLAKSWVPRWLRRPASLAASAVERLAAGGFGAIVAATPTIAARFPPDRTHLVRNFPDARRGGMEGEPRGGAMGGEPRPFRERDRALVYVGALSRTRGVVTMVEAVDRLPAGLGAHLVLAGRFAPPALEGECRAMPGWGRTRYVGRVAHAEALRLMGEARVGLAVLQPTPAHVEAYPTKLFEYMLAATPVVVSDFPLWRGIVERAGCGLLVDPEDVDAIAAAAAWLLEHEEEAAAMGRRGRAAVLEEYDWSSEARTLLTVYESLRTDRA
jgi:glycosyltransferase involved in cell wall biosynthesis